LPFCNPAPLIDAPACLSLPPAERVAGTDWLEVVCDDGKKYYHNPKSGETSWHVPPEVESKQKLKLDPVKAKMLERARAMGAQLAPEYRDGGWVDTCLLMGGRSGAAAVLVFAHWLPALRLLLHVHGRAHPCLPGHLFACLPPHMPACICIALPRQGCRCTRSSR
jgi:hypothetical protein